MNLDLPLQFKFSKRTIALTLVTIIILIGIFVSLPPSNFPSKQIVSIRQGAGLLEVSSSLKAAHVVRFASVFRFGVILFGGEHKLQSGDYYMPAAEDPYTLAWRIVHGSHDIEVVKITIPEGNTVKQISALFDSRFTKFNHVAFEASAPQGYLFPDTYFIQVNATASSTSSLLQSNFHIKVDPLAAEIKASGHSIYNIIDVASVLEAEVKTPEDMALVSGIIWKRLSIDMALQVDSAPETYKRLGLPTSPINNPGLVAIKAAIHPTTSSYLYYISDKTGKTHYAKTLAEQDANIAKYLK